ncbi:MAG: DUF2480 family protein [Salibacteraceae bacterium]
MDSIENKVAKSGLKTIDLEELRPNWNIVGIDIAEHLVEGLMLREKDFRAFVNESDWSIYKDKHVHVFCSTDAIVPTWAYMLLANKLASYTKDMYFGSTDDFKRKLWNDLVDDLNLEAYTDQRVIIKGCSDEQIDESIYMKLTARLTPVVKSLMFGEPCSTVPIFKR